MHAGCNREPSYREDSLLGRSQAIPQLEPLLLVAKAMRGGVAEVIMSLDEASETENFARG